MQNAQKKKNSNGTIVPLKKVIERVGLSPEMLEFHRQKDVRHRLLVLAKKTGFDIIETATYGVHPEVRSAAIRMLSDDRHALLFVIRHSPHNDAARAAEKLLFSLSPGDAGTPETE